MPDLTPRQQEIYDSYLKTKSARATARALHVNDHYVRKVLKRCSTLGRAPGLEDAPGVPGFVIHPKTTVHYRNGSVVEEWRRLSPDADVMEEAIEALEERAKACRVPLIPAPKKTVDDLLAEISIADHHLGQLSWDKESGEDYDCTIASRLLVTGMRLVLQDIPAVAKILLVFLGDFFHSDNRAGITERSGHILDTDSRYVRRIDIGIDVACQSVELAAKKAERVEVIILPGNHDWHTSKWLARILAAYFRNTPRITIRTSPAPQQYVQHGRVLLAYTHGDTMSAKKFAALTPAAQPRLWSETQYRYCRVGHWHHRSTEEFPGIVVETLPTLAAPDAYTTEAGFSSRRAIAAYLWSAQWGLRAKMERGVEEIMAYIPQGTKDAHGGRDA